MLGKIFAKPATIQINVQMIDVLDWRGNADDHLGQRDVPSHRLVRARELLDLLERGHLQRKVGVNLRAILLELGRDRSFDKCRRKLERGVGNAFSEIAGEPGRRLNARMKGIHPAARHDRHDADPHDHAWTIG
jgi:hypothetical protein